MCEYALAGNADVIVVQFLDRFGRNSREILQRYWQLEDFGVQVVTTHEDIKEELLLLIKAGIAGAERKRTSERVRANMSRAVEKGVHATRVPFGLIKGSRIAVQRLPNLATVQIEKRNHFHRESTVYLWNYSTF